MNISSYRGISYSIKPGETPDIWNWEFVIGHDIKSGRTHAKLKELAVRRVRERINRELRRRALNPEA